METTLEQKQAMKLLAELSQEVDLHREMVIDHVEALMRRKVESSSLKVAKAVRDQNNFLLTHDLNRLLVRRFLADRGSQLSDITDKNYRGRLQTRKVHEEFDHFKLTLENILSGEMSVVHQDIAPPARIKAERDERMAEQTLLQLFDNQMEDHFTKLYETNELKTHRLSKIDVPDVKRFYGDHMFTGRGLLDALLKDDPGNQSLLWDFEDEEGPMMRDMLERTAIIEKQGGLHKREEETMTGWVMEGLADPHDILGVVAHTTAPINPKKNTAYYRREEAFINRATFPTDDEDRTKDAFTDILLHTGRNARLAFVGGKAPGAATTIHAMGLRHLPETGVDGDDEMITYAMSELEVMRGKRHFRQHIGQNRRSIRLLLNSGYSITTVTDFDAKGPYKYFLVETPEGVIRLGARALWIYLRGRFEKVLRGSQEALKK